MEYYLAFKKKEIPIHVIRQTANIALRTKWLTEIGQSPKDKYCVIPLT